MAKDPDILSKHQRFVQFRKISLPPCPNGTDGQMGQMGGGGRVKD